MKDRDPKEVFKETLEGTYIDWPTYCCKLLDIMVVAECREKDFCEDSRWWMHRMKELDSTLTEEQQIYFDEVYQEWLDKTLHI